MPVDNIFRFAIQTRWFHLLRNKFYELMNEEADSWEVYIVMFFHMWTNIP